MDSSIESNRRTIRLAFEDVNSDIQAVEVYLKKIEACGTEEDGSIDGSAPWRRIASALSEAVENASKLTAQVLDLYNDKMIERERNPRERAYLTARIQTCLARMRSHQDLLIKGFLPDLELAIVGKPMAHVRLARANEALDQEAEDKANREKKIKDKEAVERRAKENNAYIKAAADRAAKEKEARGKEAAGEAAKARKSGNWQAANREVDETSREGKEARQKATKPESPLPGELGWFGSLMSGMDKAIKEAGAKKDAVKANTSNVDTTRDHRNTGDGKAIIPMTPERIQQNKVVENGPGGAEYGEVQYCPDGHEHNWDVMAADSITGIATKICWLCGTSSLFLPQKEAYGNRDSALDWLDWEETVCELWKACGVAFERSKD
ncbi:hypothetical protein E2P81_ATG07294 [Venturia nashicola]|uniref:Uncharacterized protein n=1 Tax=Venturia nashicola TaxID=86259 RepID=A0A4Z1PBU0_9PEZI|nr:hypothetical protein E6O75_ATG07454 [Venturia nashicola]TLD31804.1 hypothetical protein E2P81_ATG07294 [Venturia nashicola]